jgi:hypothetical protein
MVRRIIYIGKGGRNGRFTPFLETLKTRMDQSL